MDSKRNACQTEDAAARAHHGGHITGTPNHQTSARALFPPRLPSPAPPLTNAATSAPRRSLLPGWFVSPAAPPPRLDGVRLLLPRRGARLAPRGGRGNRVAHLLPPLLPARVFHHGVHRGAIRPEVRAATTSPPPPPPLPSTPPPAARRRKREPSYWRMAPEEALRYAKKEIRDAEPVIDEPDLYAPLFKNVSQFKRSYELMERILKVYIYQDGRRPMFHTPPLSGIYASEGWFMKLLKESRRFVVADASKAHLFYLPYSSQQLRLTLYVADSHDLRPLAVYLRNSVRGLANKYPFWNRTRGADHFLVACHDWGPYTMTAHGDLRRNTIKALCNADSSEGIFTPGKDVSLPETTIRTPKRPLRYVGGLPVSRRGILAFFAGNVHGRVRPVLLKHWGNGQDDDIRVYGLLPSRVSRRMSYIQHMKNSRFCLCPMGYEVNSPRIVEALYYECVPVIIADNFVLPLSEVLDWTAFSVVVAEKDIPDLKRILQRISLRRYVAMHNCVKRLQRHFLWHARPIKYDLFHMILHSIWLSRVNQVEIEG